ncbi:hypothetical protein M3Y95_00131800 [Aphelenchoides besseyi]|nr:hypothetical protein M3Y95_00131800 [Aphelenchoides besseyi]
MPNVIEWSVFIFTVITIPLYILLLSVIRETNEKRSSASFYLICEIVGYIDVVCLLNTYLTYQFAKWGWFADFYLSTGSTLLRIGFFISWASGVSQVHSTILLALNRFTAIVFVHKHDLYWRRSSRIWIYLFILLPSILMGSATLLSPVEYQQTESGGLIQKLQNKFLTHVYFGFVGALMVIYSTIIVFQYSMILYSLHKHQSKKTTTVAITTAYVNRATVQRKREHRLLLMSLLVCSLQLIVTTYIITKFVLGSAFDSELNLYNFLDTLYSAINPYLLFAFSDLLRKRMIRRAFCCLRYFLRVHQRPLSPAAALSAKTFPYNKKSATVT